MALDGGTGNDNIAGTANDEIINGLGGNDTLDSSGGGIDTLYGGDGNDFLYVRTDYEAYGGAGNDTLFVYGDNPSVLDGGADYDILQFGSGFDITGATITGIEQLNAYGDGRLTTAQLGSFALISGYDTGYTSASLVLTAGGTATVNLSSTLTSYFQITGSSQADRLTFNASYVYKIYAYMGGGNDKVTGGSGDDSLRGEAGNDTLVGGLGNDSIDGGIGADSLSGGAGNDTLIATVGDTVLGGADDDLISVNSSGVASISGNAGNDTLRTESSYDLSSTLITGDIEHFQVGGQTSLTTTQLGLFGVVEGYNNTSTYATVKLTAGGTAAVTLADTLTQTFTVYGSGQADLLTFAGGHAGAISASLGDGNDSIQGSDGNDSLYGEFGADTLNGGAGNDVLDGGDSQDLLIGGNGDDYLVMRTGDSGQGGSGNDMLSVESNFASSLDGGTGTGDILRFASSYDISGATLTGIEQLNLNGADSMTASQLAMFTRVQGYADNYTTAGVYLTEGGTAAVNVMNFLTGGFWLYGSTGADLITISSSYNFAVTAFGYGGNDSLVGGSGNDNLNGGLGADTLMGGAGNDTLNGEADDAADQIFGGNGNDYIAARSHDIISGDAGTDFIDIFSNDVASVDGGTGQDTLRVGAGYDISQTVVTGIEQLNLYYGGRVTAAQLDGVGTVSGYDTPYTSASVSLSQGGTATVRLSSTLTSGFTLQGSSDNDILTFVTSATTAVNVNGAEGNDVITGGNGMDSIVGGLGDDTLDGGNGNDTLDGSIGNDSLTGGAGNDVLIGRTGSRLFGGNDDDLLSIQDNGVAIINGGSGNDTLRTESSYDLTGASIVGVEVLAVNSVYLTTAQLNQFGTVTGYSPGTTSAYLYLTAGGTATLNLSATLSYGVTIYGASDAETLTVNAGYAGRVTFNGGFGGDVITAGAGLDTLSGNGGNDMLSGLGGADALYGGAGKDTLVGGDGSDSLYGGGGQDVFAFTSNTQSSAGAPDQIFDFEGAGAAKGDIIDLSAIDADGGLGTQDSFIFGSTGLAGLSIVDDGAGNTLVRLNTNNDAAFEVVIKIVDGGVLFSAYTAADFIL